MFERHRMYALLTDYINHNGPRLGAARRSTSMEVERITDTQSI
jgi:hypothetical protein